MKSEPVVIDAHGRHAHAVQFTRDGKRLLSVGQDTRVRIWSVPGFEPAGTFDGHAKSVNTLSLAPGERRLATGSSDGTVRIWSFPEGDLLRVLSRQVSAVFSPGEDHLATLSAKGRVVLWEPEEGREITTLPNLDRRIFSIAFAPDGKNLLLGGTGPIHRVEVPSGEPLGMLEGHEVAVGCLRFSPDGALLASTGADRSIRLWSASDWSEVRRIDLEAGGILQIAFSPDGETLAVGADHRILVHAVQSGEILHRIELQPKGIYGLAVSPDGRFLANAAADGKVRIWERTV
jgi:WD40 repeat protein